MRARSVCTVLTVLTVITSALPASAEKIVSSSSSACEGDLCAQAFVRGTIDCDQVAPDTVSCSGAVIRYARVNFTGWPYLRWPGSATWQHRAGCGWFVVGGYDQSCEWENITETRSWEMNDLGDTIFISERSFGPVSHSSPDPFCLFMYLDAGSAVSATSKVLGLVEEDTVETAAGFFEEGDIACASGGTDPGA